MSDLITREKEFEFLSKQALYFAKSNLVPKNFQDKPADIFLACKMGQELGLSEVQSLNSIHVIQGRPSLSAQTMIALIRKRYPDAYIKITGDDKSAACTMAVDREFIDDAYEAKWDMERAKRMGLIGKDNWIKQPGIMMKWRCVSEAARFVFPDAIMNLYTPEEAEEIKDSLQDQLNDDYGNPNAGIELGDPEYKILYGKHRGQKLKELTEAEIEARIDYLESKKDLNENYNEILRSCRAYMENLDKTIEVKNG